MTSSFPEVHVLQAGYARWSPDGKSQRADGTIALVIGEKKIVVDTGLPKDKALILAKLAEYKLTPEAINAVVCTHGDADHISNVNLFPNAELIVGFDIYHDDEATFFQKNYLIAPNITATEMLGHDDRSIGVLVQTVRGLIAITGDLFEAENDWQDVASWLAFSKKPKQHVQTRARIWELADYIVPGHGPMFKVDKSIDILAHEKAALSELLATTSNVYGDVEV